MGSLPNRILWNFISGSAVLRPEEVIARELNKNKDRLFAGLSGYSKQRQPVGEQLAVEKKLEGRKLEFVQKLARFLALEELLCYELFLSFLAYEYRSSKKALQHVLNSDRHSQVLMYRIRDFYFTERLYILRCLKQVLSFGIDSEHPYKNVYANFVGDLVENHRLINSIQDQYEDCCDTPLPTSSTSGILMTQTQQAIWARQNLMEQCELLELMLIYFKDYEPVVKRFLSLFEKFKLMGFAKYQTYKRILDESTEDLVKRLGYLQVLVILDCLDFELVQRCHMDGRFDGHPLFKDMQTFKKLDKLMCDMGSLTFHGPLLLGWVLVRQLLLEEEEDAVTKKMGAMALKLNCFGCLSDLLSTEPFNGASIVASVSNYLVYMLLCSVLRVFHEDRLGDNKSVNQLVELVLQKKFVSEDVWERGLEDGLGLLYHGALSKFPMEFPPFLQYSIAMATAGEQSARNVLTHLQKLQVYTEYLDRNSMQDLSSVDDRDALWRLTRNKTPYGTGGRYSLIIPQNTIGMLYKPDKGSPIIQWSWTYNGWNLFMCEMELLLQQLSHGGGSVSVIQITKVTLVVKLIKVVLTSDPSSVDQLEGSYSLIYKLIQRCARLSSPPLELISHALECLACVTQKYPFKVWHGMKQTGLLPFLTENLDNMAEVLSGQGLQPGLYGSQLAIQECSQGSYPITQAFLAFLAKMVKPLRKEKRSEELTGSVLFILRQVFPVFHKWRYYDKGRREVIGQNCLDLFHEILDFMAEEKSQKEQDTKSKPTLQAACVHCLLYTEAGKALLELVSAGVDNIDVALSHQTSTFEGPGIELIHLTKLAFSVLNRLLLLKSPDLPMSPVEHALASQPAGQQHRHIVVTMAQYIYHRHDPRLPTIATLLLKRLAVISPMSILACLGDAAEPIRDMYLLRLQAATEAIRLKVCILELLTVCVETQPGLIELFLNIQPKPASDGKKDLGLGKFSCLQTVLDLIEEKAQGTYQCPPLLLCACLQFIHALWTGQRETAMMVLRSRASFWTNVVTPLMKNLPKNADLCDDVVICTMKTAGFAMKILAQEFYTVPRSKLDKSLHKVLQNLNEKKRLGYWSSVVRDAMVQEGTESTVVMETMEDNPTLKLLSSWKTFLITSLAQMIEEFQIDENLTEEILSDLMTGLQAQFSADLSPLNVKLASVSSALYCTLMKPLGKLVKRVSPVLKEIEMALLQSCTNFQNLLPSVQIGLLGSATSLVQRARQDTNVQVAPDVLSSLLAVLAPLLQHSTRLCVPSASLSDTPRETPTKTTMDVKIKLQVLALSLMQEIIQMMEDSDQWLPILQQNTVISSLLVSLQVWMKAKQGVQYVQSAVMLLFTIAASAKGAECIRMNGLTEHTCLSIVGTYQNEELLSQMSNFSRGGDETHVSGEEVSWVGVYCLCIDLYTSMLATLRYSFLKDALDFAGVHQDRLQQALELSRTTLHEKVWREAKKTCTFIFQLSNFSREWRLELPKVLDRLLTSMSYMFQSFTALLIRPRYLQHLLERQSRSKGSDLQLSRPQSLQTQASMDDLDNPSPQLRPVQQLMLEILAAGLSTLRHFTPGLCEIMLDLSLDISEFPPFLGLSFGTPSGDQDCAPTFGTLLAGVTACVSMLMKMDQRIGSPQKSPAVDHSHGNYPSKNLVQFVMENSLYLVLSQACRYLREPELAARDKQLLKRELSTELNCFLTSYHRYLKRGSPPSPGGSSLVSPGGTAPSRSGVSISRSMSSSTFSMAQDQAFCKLVEAFVRKVLG